ncbi:MAG: PorT family protein [Bacteroidaceae bacterium]|nr:PorT family protein [Bacteroidaceae bacterium]
MSNYIQSHNTVLRIALLCLLTMSSAIMSAQTRKVMFRPYIDQRRFHYGFFVGTHMQDIELKHNGYTDENGNQWFAETPNYEPGFSVGILGEMYLTKHLSLRLIPSMHFGTKNMTFRNEKDYKRQYMSMKSTYISLPLDLKFSAERFNNYRPYMMAGISPTLDLTIKRQKEILLKNFDCYLEAGIGCDFYAPWFKFIPEIKFCYGLRNIIEKERTDLTDENMLIYTKSIDSGRSKMIVLTLYFE